MADVGSVIIITLGLLAFSFIGCCGLCFVCCAIPLLKIFSNMIRSMFGMGTSNPNRNQGEYGTEYELVRTSDESKLLESGYHQQSTIYATPSAPPLYVGNEPIAEAYLVPPLVDTHTANSVIVLGEDVSQGGGRVYKKGFRDIWAAMLFLLNGVIMIYFAAQAILYYTVKIDQPKYFNGGTDDFYLNSMTVMQNVLLFGSTLAVLATVLGSMVLTFLINHAENLIEYVMWANIAMQGLTAVLCFLTLQIIGALIFAVMAGVNYWYLLSVRSQIPFSSAVLATACTAIKANYTGLLATAYSALLVQLIWVSLWSISLSGVLALLSDDHSSTATTTTSSSSSHSNKMHSYDHVSSTSYSHSSSSKDASNSNNDGTQLWVLFLLLISLYWGIQVIKSVVQTTVCGTLACWWFQPKRESPVRGSLFRSLTTSFGSICFGSLIVAVISALREIVYILRMRAQQAATSRDSRRDSNALAVAFASCLYMITEYLLSCLEAAAQYFNKYAFCYVAAYGLGFIESGKQVTALFENR